MYTRGIHYAGVVRKFCQGLWELLSFVNPFPEVVKMQNCKCTIANAWAGLEVGVGLNSREAGLRMKDCKSTFARHTQHYLEDQHCTVAVIFLLYSNYTLTDIYNSMTVELLAVSCSVCGICCLRCITCELLIAW